MGNGMLYFSIFFRKTKSNSLNFDDNRKENVINLMKWCIKFPELFVQMQKNNTTENIKTKMQTADYCIFFSCMFFSSFSLKTGVRKIWNVTSEQSSFENCWKQQRKNEIKITKCTILTNIYCYDKQYYRGWLYNICCCELEPVWMKIPCGVRQDRERVFVQEVHIKLTCYGKQVCFHFMCRAEKKHILNKQKRG